MALINVDLGTGEITQMDDSLLEHRVENYENDNEILTADEYWLDGRLVHRSAHMHLKHTIFCEAVAADIA